MCVPQKQSVSLKRLFSTHMNTRFCFYYPTRIKSSENTFTKHQVCIYTPSGHLCTFTEWTEIVRGIEANPPFLCLCDAKKDSSRASIMRWSDLCNHPVVKLNNKNKFITKVRLMMTHRNFAFLLKNELTTKRIMQHDWQDIYVEIFNKVSSDLLIFILFLYLLLNHLHVFFWFFLLWVKRALKKGHTTHNT